MKYLILILTTLTFQLTAQTHDIHNTINCTYDTIIKKYIKQFPYYVTNKTTGTRKKYYINSNLIKAIITQESGGNPKAISHAGARGLMQIMPRTARALGADPKRLHEVKHNLKHGIMFVAVLLTNVKGNDLIAALSGYNGGYYYTKTRSVKDKDFSGRIYNHPETRNYINAVISYFEYYKMLNNFNRYIEKNRTFTIKPLQNYCFKKAKVMMYDKVDVKRFTKIFDKILKNSVKYNIISIHKKKGKMVKSSGICNR